MKKILLTALAVLILCAGARAEESMSEKFARMTPVFDALTRAMGVEGEIPYDADDPAFVWTTADLAGETDATDAFLRAAFGGAQSIPARPDDLEPVASVPNDNYTAVECYALNGEGHIVAGAGYYTYEGARLGGIDFTLTENAPDAPYPYMVLDAAPGDGGAYDDLSACGLTATGIMDVVTYELPLRAGSGMTWKYAFSRADVAAELVNTLDKVMSLYVFTFESVAPGETDLTFSLVPEGGGDPVDTRQYHITVAGDGMIDSAEKP